ncbi:phosphotransferase [Granulicatella sp. 19428wC4_WM01]|nr:phosphotransferase [Granulicatella sp. 19428wC4_WM01]TFU93838.1 hypothetical protein E4T68_06745 [Granulicatella sp. WM01]
MNLGKYIDRRMTSLMMCNSFDKKYIDKIINIITRVNILAISEDNKKLFKKVLLHNDLKIENIIVDGENVIFLDFENSCYGPIIFDVNRILWRICKCNIYSKLWKNIVKQFHIKRTDMIIVRAFIILQCIGAINYYENLNDNDRKIYQRIYVDARYTLKKI